MLETWLLSRQETGAVVTTCTGAAAGLAGGLLWPALLLALVLSGASAPAWTVAGLASRAAAGALAILAVGLAASLATGIFFLAARSCPPRVTAVGALALGAAWLLLWLWLERAENGWQGPWERHPARLLSAFLFLTPMPVLFGLAARDWWGAQMAQRLPGSPDPLLAALLLGLFYLAAILYLLHLSRRGYRALWSDPESLTGRRGDGETGRGGALGEEGSESAFSPRLPVSPSPRQEDWPGFRNPVWTRELRTRLRGREAAEVIFFASICIAAAGFLPLALSAGQLEDPLAVAAVARDVFFWLSLTLVAFLTLLIPGLTAEAVGAERAHGTLELLLATPMRGAEILRGKLLSAVSVALLLLSPSLPLFGLVTLFHGADLAQVVGTYLALTLHLALCAGFGVTASALHDRILPAKIQAYLLAFGAACLPGGALWAVAALATPEAGAAGAPGVLFLSPGLLIFCACVLVWCWAAAAQRLTYAE
jgi:hypothetical protein